MLNKGYIYLSLAQIAVATNVILGKFLSFSLSSFVYVGSRFFVSSIIFLILFAGQKQKKILTTNGNKKSLLLLIGYCLSGGFLFNILFFEGLSSTSATSAGIIGSVLPCFIAFMAFVFLQESLSSKKILSIILACLGILILNTGFNNNFSLTFNRGDIFILIAMIPQAIYSIISRKARGQFHIITAALMLNISALILFFPINFKILENDQTQLNALLDTFNITLIFFSGVCSFLFFYLWTLGLQKVEASIAAIFGSIFPLFTTILAVTFLEETLSISDTIAMALIISSILLGAQSATKNTKV
ncbi:DMT family transporter [Spartinivicinus ruber]|uniref:DMT family transporter n=1 Tax=Spartinivicinus ruber TaxID=2683272 RepID=UPI0013D2FC5F|nr:DMT family transporter [Spartinivicinus ruber]